jgi:hypothetical protein
VVGEHEDVEPAEEHRVDMEEVTGHQSLRLYGQELRPSRSASPRRRLDTVTLQDRPDARGGDDNAHGGELALDAAVAPLWILLRQPEEKCRGSLRDAWSTGPGVRVGPVPGDEAPVPTKQSCRLDEEASESSAGEQPCEPRQHRSICRLQRRPVDLAPEDCHLVAQHDDLDGETRGTPTNESDELKEAAESPVYERESHRRMFAADGTKRQSPAHGCWMTFSAPTGSQTPCYADPFDPLALEFPPAPELKLLATSERDGTESGSCRCLTYPPTQAIIRYSWMSPPR